MSNLLIQEVPLMVLPTLAARIGLNEAMFLQQLHYWVDRSNHEMEGRKWIYNTIEEWCSQFPFWSRRTLTRIISTLERNRLILAANYNRKGFDRTKWYTVNYERLSEMESEPAASDTAMNENAGGETGNEQTEGERNLLTHSAPAEDAEEPPCQPAKNPLHETDSVSGASDMANGSDVEKHGQEGSVPKEPVGGTSIVSNWHNEENQGLAGISTATAGQIGTSIMSDWHIPLCQNGTMDHVNLAQPIPENNNREYPQRTTTTARTSQLPMEEPPKPGKVDLLLLSAPRYGLQEATVRRYIREFGEKLVLREFELLKKLIEQKKPIQNPAGWFRRALEQEYKDTQADYEKIQAEKKAAAEARNRERVEFYRQKDAEERAKRLAAIPPSSPLHKYLRRHGTKGGDAT